MRAFDSHAAYAAALVARPLAPFTVEELEEALDLALEACRSETATRIADELETR